MGISNLDIMRVLGGVVELFVPLFPPLSEAGQYTKCGIYMLNIGLFLPFTLSGQFLDRWPCLLQVKQHPLL